MRAFCESTSLHGWPHLPRSSAKERFFWVLAIIGSLIASVYLGKRLYRYFGCILLYSNFSFRTFNQFKDSTVVTVLVTNTEDVTKAVFPKIILKNKYTVR